VKPSNLRLSVQSHWLLWFIAERGSVHATLSMPAHWSQQPGMVHLRGLIRRGWVDEANNNHIYYVTDLGRSAAKLMGPPPMTQQEKAERAASQP